MHELEQRHIAKTYDGGLGLPCCQLLLVFGCEAQMESCTGRDVAMKVGHSSVFETNPTIFSKNKVFWFHFSLDTDEVVNT